MIRPALVTTAVVALAGCGSSHPATPAVRTAAAAPATTASAAKPHRQPARRGSSPYRAGSRFDLAFRRGYAECQYLRYGSGWTAGRAVQTVRAESEADFKDPAALGCAKAYGLH